MKAIRKIIALATVLAASSTLGLGQTVEQPIILVIDTEDLTAYVGDVTDATKLSRDTDVTIPGPGRSFYITYQLADVVAINGKPAKGLNSTFVGSVPLSVAPQPGQAIADFNGSAPISADWQIFGSDGTWIGSFWGRGTAASGRGYAILGGQGAFFGVTGELRVTAVTKPPRSASATEDPAKRRLNGGGKVQFTFYIYPKYRPEVDITPSGPAIFHEDFSPVSAGRPARVGELLIIRARNLGPVRPDLLPPGVRPFKADSPEEVNSPVDVTMNGKTLEVINKVGWPGAVDLYRVDVRVPSGLTAGMATIQLTAAWIPGPTVDIPAQ
ncbi:MAG: hypothetical protein IT165_23445 [Bryobacterales bacterium]|nr:hypothetical protein [Bryobacterales bacterium]